MTKFFLIVLFSSFLSTETHKPPLMSDLTVDGKTGRITGHLTASECDIKRAAFNASGEATAYCVETPVPTP